MQYFEPDSRWELYQISSVEEYVDKFVVKGKFQSAVPNDIQESWQTVEYLLAHAYYHWPMYDEGFKKALLIIEIAVKLKAKEKGIALEEKANKAGKQFEKKLSKLICEVFVGKHYQILQNDIDRARNIRNILVHPDRNTYNGAIGNIKGNLMFLINVLNDIFRSEEEHFQRYQNSVELSEAFKVFDKSLLVLEYHKPSILIEKILDFSLMNNKLYLFLNPVRTNISEIMSNHFSLNPEVVCLEKFEMEGSELKGITSGGTEIRIHKTDKPENQNLFNDYLIQIAQGDKMDWVIYHSALQNNTGWKKVKLIYEDLLLDQH